MSNRKRWVSIGVVALALAAGLGAYLVYGNDRASTNELVLYGNIDVREALLGFNNAGRVDGMLAEEGDRVKKGQLLATIEDGRFKAEVASATAKVSAQRAVLDRLLRGSRPEEIKQARASAKAIAADLANAKQTLARSERLVLRSDVSRQKLGDDRARVESLAARLTAARQALSLVIQGPRKEDIAAARAQLRAEEAALALAQQRMIDTKMYAKAGGIVLTRIVEPGQVVLANSPVYSVAIIEPVWVRTYVPEPFLGRIRPGMKAFVFTDSHPDRALEGRVGFISPVAEFTPKSVETPEVRTTLVYRVRIYVKGSSATLRQGMPVTIRLELNSDMPPQTNRKSQ